MAYPSFIPVNASIPFSQDVQTRPTTPLPADAARASLTPTSSVRDAILAAAERLEQQTPKRRKIAASKPHTRSRKPKEYGLTDACRKKAIPVKTTDGIETTLNAQLTEENGREQSTKVDSLADLSRKTIDRLDAFRFPPPLEAAIPESLSRPSLAPKDSPMKAKNPLDTPVSNQNSDTDETQKQDNELMYPQESMETTLPVDHNSHGYPHSLDKEHVVYDKPGRPSPPPLEYDDFDQGSLEEAFAEAVDDEEQEIVFGYPDTQYQISPVEPDFGSDPFEPDDDRHQIGSQQSSSAMVDPFDSPPLQKFHIDLLKDETRCESMPTPAYQTPRKSTSSIEKTSKELPAFQSLTPDSHSINSRPFSQQSSPAAFLRHSFPKPVLPRSPISNLTPAIRILTCFRTAEYLRAISSIPSTAGLLIELYALVTSSTRIGNCQYFTFTDLFFPHQPPHIQGTCVTWQGSTLYEDDTKPFLGATKEKGTMCRAIVRSKKVTQPSRASGTSLPHAKRFAVEGGSPGRGVGEQGQSPPSACAEVEVLNIWEAGWDDVEYVKGIVGA